LNSKTGQKEKIEKKKRGKRKRKPFGEKEKRGKYAESDNMEFNSTY